MIEVALLIVLAIVIVASIALEAFSRCNPDNHIAKEAEAIRAYRLSIEAKLEKEALCRRKGEVKKALGKRA